MKGTVGSRAEQARSTVPGNSHRHIQRHRVHLGVARLSSALDQKLTLAARAVRDWQTETRDNLSLSIQDDSPALVLLSLKVDALRERSGPAESRLRRLGLDFAC